MAVTHNLVELFALGGCQCIPRIEPEVDRGLLKRQSRRADFLKLRVNRGPVRLVGGKQVPQVNLLHLEIGSAADFGLTEVGFLLANLCGLFGAHAKLLAHGRVAQQAPETKFPASHTLVHAHPVATSLASTTPVSFVTSSSPIVSVMPGTVATHVTSMSHSILGALIIGRRTWRVTLSENGGTTDHQSQSNKRSFRVS
jgi:hypothetical protein